MTKKLFNIFGPIAFIGLTLSIATHVTALLGRSGPLGDYAMVLHVGIFVVWIPALIAGILATRGGSRADAKNAFRRVTPLWIRLAINVLFMYALFNFFLAYNGRDRDQPLSVRTNRAFSGHWMLFYGAALVGLYSAAKISEGRQKCPNGHDVPADARFCASCGATMASDTSNRLR